MSINMDVVNKHIVATVNERGHWEVKSHNLSVSIRRVESQYILIVRQADHEHTMETTCLFSCVAFMCTGLENHWHRLTADRRAVAELQQQLNGHGDVDALAMP